MQLASMSLAIAGQIVAPVGLSTDLSVGLFWTKSCELSLTFFAYPRATASNWRSIIILLQAKSRRGTHERF